MTQWQFDQILSDNQQWIQEKTWFVKNQQEKSKYYLLI